MDDDMHSIGTGIYLNASVIDHSCEPSAVAVFEGTTLYIRAIKDLPEFDWNLVGWVVKVDCEEAITWFLLETQIFILGENFLHWCHEYP